MRGAARRVLVGGVCALALLCPAANAVAQDGKAEKRAATYEKRAKQAYVKKQWDDAIAAFELAYETVPQPKYLFNIGKAMERKGDLFGAMELMNRYIAAVKDEKDREEAMVLRDVIAAKLRKTSGVLRLSTRPTGAAARLQRKDQVIVATTPFERWLDIGEWSLEVALQDHRTHTDKIVVGLGETQEQILDLEPVEEAAPTPAPVEPVAAVQPPQQPPPAEPPVVAQPTPPPAPEPEPPQVEAPRPMAPPPDPGAEPEPGGALATWGWILGGAGAAAAGVGIWSFTQVGAHLDERDAWKGDYDNSTAPDDVDRFRFNAEVKQEDAERSLIVGQILTGVGSALVTTGIILLLADGAPAAAPAGAHAP